MGYSQESQITRSDASSGKSVRTIEVTTQISDVQYTTEQQVVTLADANGELVDFSQRDKFLEAILLEQRIHTMLLTKIANEGFNLHLRREDLMDELREHMRKNLQKYEQEKL